MPPELGPLYKWIDGDRRSCHGGTPLQWPAPAADAPGEWMPAVALPLLRCANGYHVLEGADLVLRSAETLWRVEARGKVLVCEGEVVVEQARLLRQMPWDARIARLYACDCAERVVRLCGDDPRPREAIAVARRYADGQATDEELASAWADARAATKAEDAAWASAWDAAADAAEAADAAAAADVAAAAADAAAAAAWAAAAAEAAEAAAAKVAARVAERRWQARHLLELLGEDPSVIPA